MDVEFLWGFVVCKVEYKVDINFRFYFWFSRDCIIIYSNVVSEFGEKFIRGVKYCYILVVIIIK